MKAAVGGGAGGTRRPALVSPLELFHPNGIARGVLVHGDAHSSVVPPHVSSAEEIDLLIVAPTRAQLRSPGWLEGVLAGSLPRLVPEGIVYLLVPSYRLRRRARRLLKRHGLPTLTAVAHLPDARSSRYLVPLKRKVAKQALSEIVPVWPRRRRALTALLRIPGAAPVVTWLLPSVALIAQERGARPLFDWIARFFYFADRQPAVVMTGGEKGSDRAVVFSPASGVDRAGLVGKVRGAGSPELEREGRLLAAIAPTARAAGAEVPEVLLIQPLAEKLVLFETAVPGTSAAALLASRPRAIGRLLGLVTDWLEVWERATTVRRRPARGELESLVLTPARLVLSGLEGSGRYLVWLEDRCRAVAMAPIPFVAAHNDLTMFNVLLRRRRLGVVDWESATDAQLPLSDFVYAAVDAASAVSAYTDRAQALQQCFLADGRFRALVQSLQHQLVSALRVPPAVAQLSFHACWLQHAANEKATISGSSDRPFLTIVEQLAAMPETWVPPAK